MVQHSEAEVKRVPPESLAAKALDGQPVLLTKYGLKKGVETMLFGVHLVRQGHISPRQFVDAVEQELSSRTPLGELAMRMGKLSMRQVFAVLSAQIDCQKPFGRVAVEMGFLSEFDLAELLLHQLDATTPLTEVLVAMGAVEQEVVEREVSNFRRRQAEKLEAAQTSVLSV